MQVQWSDGRTTFTQIAALATDPRAYHLQGRASSTPSYLSDLLHPVTSSRSSWPVDCPRLQTHRTRPELGKRTFSVATPTVWILLPAQLRLRLSYRFFKNHVNRYCSLALFSLSVTYCQRLCILGHHGAIEIGFIINFTDQGISDSKGKETRNLLRKCKRWNDGYPR